MTDSPRSPIAQYAVVTGSYWAFTLTDGALRMLVVLYFHQLGYSPLEVAMLFLLYEFFGIVTNLLGGWLAAYTGLARTLVLGLSLQSVALLMLTVEASWLSVPYVMAAQALSGIAKDLSKMSAKSSVKLLVKEGEQGRLYRWVAVLTGSKNTLKGLGFFLGGVLLTQFGFQGAVFWLAVFVALVALGALFTLNRESGRSRFKPKFTELLSKSSAINRLSAARLFLFGARDIWFVVALPVYLQSVLQWSSTAVGTLLAGWIILYGFVQSGAPWLTGRSTPSAAEGAPGGATVAGWGFALCVCTLLLWYVAVSWLPALEPEAQGLVLVLGLLAFGALFALNSAVHSYLVVAYADADAVSLDVGFYYMSNAAGRLLGTLLSGWLYQSFGLATCLAGTALFVLLAALVALALPATQADLSSQSAPRHG